MRRPRLGDLVEVVWQDAITCAEWFEGDLTAEHKSRADMSAMHKTVGYVKRWDTDTVTLAQNHALTHQRYSELFDIPRKMVGYYTILTGIRYRS